MTYKVAAFYRFTPLDDIPALRRAVQDLCDARDLCGTILLAPEGINGTIAGTPQALDHVIEALDHQFGIRQGELKFSEAAIRPFNKMKVRPKKEIITMRAAAEADPNKQVGTYVTPERWNEIISDPDVTLVDTRNEYETRVGLFRGALDPQIDNFTDFKDYVETNLDPGQHKKVAMYCTGGIRCEKASAYMLAKGFEEVYHLKGGILEYLEKVRADESLWDGACFVFDQRVAVGHGLEESAEWDVCYGCREPITADDRAAPSYERGVSCPHCIDELTPERAQALRARHREFQNREFQNRKQEQQEGGAA